jgi:hypothetical protein
MCAHQAKKFPMFSNMQAEEVSLSLSLSLHVMRLFIFDRFLFFPQQFPDLLFEPFM